MHKRASIKKVVFFYSGIVTILAVFLFGFSVGAMNETRFPSMSLLRSFVRKISTSTDQQNVLDMGLFWEVWNNIQDQYVERPIDQEVLLHGAITGLVESLDDPYSIFLDKEMTDSFQKEMNGTFEGIGVEIGKKKGFLVVIAPLPDTPAEREGMRSGDIIAEIDGVSTMDMSIDGAVRNIRGEKGTTVKLRIVRKGDTEPRTFSIVRDIIKIQTVVWNMREDDIAYIKLSHFVQDTEKQFQNIAHDILLADPKGVILDLRNNPGGFLDTAVDIASMFFDKGTVVLIEDFGDGRKEEYKTRRSSTTLSYPLVALVNEGTASASEIVAGALQDYKKAVIIGEQTFGKGSVQGFETFSNGSSLKLTVAHWLTPSGRSINKDGIMPDTIVKRTTQEYEEDKDPQLEEAVKYLLK